MNELTALALLSKVNDDLMRTQLLVLIYNSAVTESFRRQTVGNTLTNTVYSSRQVFTPHPVVVVIP